MRFYAERPLRVAWQLLADVAGDRLGVRSSWVRAGGAEPRRPAPGACGGADGRPGRRCATRSQVPRGRRPGSRSWATTWRRRSTSAPGPGDSLAAAGQRQAQLIDTVGLWAAVAIVAFAAVPVVLLWLVRAAPVRAHGGLGGGRARPRPRPPRPPRARAPADPAAAAGVGRPGGGVAARRHRRRARPRDVGAARAGPAVAPTPVSPWRARRERSAGACRAAARGSGPRRRTPRPGSRRTGRGASRRRARQTSASRYWASVSTVRRIGLPSDLRGDRGEPARSRAAEPVSGGVGPSKRPSSVRTIAAASARSSCAVQETGPSAGRRPPRSRTPARGACGPTTCRSRCAAR